MKNHALCCLVLVSLDIWDYSNGYNHNESSAYHLNVALILVQIYRTLQMIEFIVFMKLL